MVDTYYPNWKIEVKLPSGNVKVAHAGGNKGEDPEMLKGKWQEYFAELYGKTLLIQETREKREVEKKQETERIKQERQEKLQTEMETFF